MSCDRRINEKHVESTCSRILPDRKPMHQQINKNVYLKNSGVAKNLIIQIGLKMIIYDKEANIKHHIVYDYICIRYPEQVTIMGVNVAAQDLKIGVETVNECLVCLGMSSIC